MLEFTYKALRYIVASYLNSNQPSYSNNFHGGGQDFRVALFATYLLFNLYLVLIVIESYIALVL